MIGEDTGQLICRSYGLFGVLYLGGRREAFRCMLFSGPVTSGIAVTLRSRRAGSSIAHTAASLFLVLHFLGGGDPAL